MQSVPLREMVVDPFGKRFLLDGIALIGDFEDAPIGRVQREHGHRLLEDPVLLVLHVHLENEDETLKAISIGTVLFVWHQLAKVNDDECEQEEEREREREKERAHVKRRLRALGL